MKKRFDSIVSHKFAAFALLGIFTLCSGGCLIFSDHDGRRHGHPDGVYQRHGDEREHRMRDHNERGHMERERPGWEHRR